MSDDAQAGRPAGAFAKLIPAQLPPVIALIAWLLIIVGATTLLSRLLYLPTLLHPAADVPNNMAGAARVHANLLETYRQFAFGIARLVCGIALLRSARWARPATLVVVAVLFLYQLYISLWLPVQPLFTLIDWQWHLAPTLISLLMGIFSVFERAMLLYLLLSPRVLADWKARKGIPTVEFRRHFTVERWLTSLAARIDRWAPAALPPEVLLVAVIMITTAAPTFIMTIETITRGFSTHFTAGRYPPAIEIPLLLLNIIMLALAVGLLRKVYWTRHSAVVLLLFTAVMSVVIFVMSYKELILYFHAMQRMQLFYSSVASSVIRLLDNVLTFGIQALFLTTPAVVAVYEEAGEERERVVTHNEIILEDQ